MMIPVFLAAASAASASELRPPALRALAPGAVKPAGWLLDQLQLQARGLTGALPEFWSYLVDSAWLPGGKGNAPPEQYVPYYLNGLVPLSYQVGGLDATRDAMVAAILDAQANATAGWLGPPVANARDYFTKYPAVEALAQHADGLAFLGDADGAAAVAAAVLRHALAFADALAAGAPPFNASRWGFARYEDGLVGLQWLLDRDDVAGGDRARVAALHDALVDASDGVMGGVAPPDGAAWEPWFESGDPFANYDDGEATGTAHLLRHGVDVGEAMKLGPLKWRRSGSPADLGSAAVALAWADAYLGEPDGMFMADEEVGGERSPSRGTETCSVVEAMYSMRVAYEITGNASFFDRYERLAFNALPAALWPDATANVYHHASNQVATGDGPYAYDLFYCCSANVHQGWPKFVAALVHVDGDGKVVVSSLAPSATALPGGGELKVAGAYPFADAATLSSDVAVDLRVRVPCWATRATAGGKPLVPCAFNDVRLAAREALVVAVEADVATKTWEPSSRDGQAAVLGGAVEVHRGPLAFALRFDTAVNETDIHGRLKRREVEAAEGAAWNYALLAASLAFDGAAGPVPSPPFAADAPPAVAVTAEARRVDKWTAAGGARGVAPPPKSPLAGDGPRVNVTLVPYGSTNLRIAVFPQLEA